jgi:hypothetical protein
MSGVEPILIGAAIGAGTSGIMGGDPLKGALLGAAGGGITSGLGGVGAAASTGASTASAPLAGVVGDTAAQTVGASMIESGTSGVFGDVMEQAALSGAQYSSNPFMAGVQHLIRDPGTTMAALGGGFDPSKMGAMAQLGGSLLGDGQSQQQRISAGGSTKQAQAPQLQTPIDELMRMQMMAQRQRRPISLL